MRYIFSLLFFVFCYMEKLSSAIKYIEMENYGTFSPYGNDKNFVLYYN